MEYNTFWSWADKYWILSQTNAEFRPDKYWQLGLDKYWQLPPKSYNCPEAPPVGTLHIIALKLLEIVQCTCRDMTIDRYYPEHWSDFCSSDIQLLDLFEKLQHIFWILMEPSCVELPHEEKKESHGS